MNAVERYRMRRYKRLLQRLDEDGDWITVNGTHIHISDEGIPDKGNPKVVAALKDKMSGKPKVSGGSISGINEGLKAFADEHNIAVDPTVRTMYEEAVLVNPNFSKGGNYATNCGSCAIAYAARRAGLDVEAIPVSDEGLSSDDLETCFDGFEFKQVVGFSIAQIKRSIANEFASCPDGAMGIIYCQSLNTGLGHLFNCETQGGKLYFIDSQNPQRNLDAILEGMDLRYFYYERIDCLGINPEITNYVRNRK